uniref:OmpA family protein n=1 Tax=Candidatus Kentrum sp. DK TaxID=2126562 RepID=A0A450TFM3_9GAMM|nr:MAG: hypothetical protein BECKDK2373C_GA0170839_11395 [Candidatus Kentron sp. DK]
MMAVNLPATLLFSMLLLSIKTAAALPVIGEQPSAPETETACSEDPLVGYPCRIRRRVDGIIKTNQESISLVRGIQLRRAAEGLQHLPIPSEFAGLFSYLRWHRELYGLDDIDPRNLLQRGAKVKEGALRIEQQKVPIPGSLAYAPSPPERDMPPEGAGAEPGKALSSKVPPEESLPLEKSSGQERKRAPIPGLPPYSAPLPSPEGGIPPEGVAPNSEPDKISSVPPSEQPPSSERSPGEPENGQGKDTGSAGAREATSPTSPPNAGKDAEGGKKQQTVGKHDKDPDDRNVQPPGSDKKMPEPAETDDGDARDGKLQGHQVRPESQEYDNVLEVLRERGDPDQVISLSKDRGPNVESAQQEIEIYRIDSCVIGQDQGESKLPADNVTGCGPSGRLLAGFEPGNYKIIKDNFLPSYQPLFAGLERSLLGYKLPENETVLILGYADHLEYRGSSPWVGKHKRCSFHAGELQFNEVEAAGDSRPMGDDGNQRLALARAREIQNWLERKGVLKSDNVCLMASPGRPKIDSVPAGEPLDRAVAVYVLRTKTQTTEANHEQP